MTPIYIEYDTADTRTAFHFSTSYALISLHVPQSHTHTHLPISLSLSLTHSF
jgi:hypothetical protein